jgi:RNA polymerase sigma-70 factor (ECF subfamily)
MAQQQSSLDAKEYADLAARLANADMSAFEAIYRKSRTILRSVIVRVLDNEGDAEEVLNDTYQQLWEQKGNYDPTKGQLLGWLIIIARRRALDRVRRRLSYFAACERYSTSLPKEVDVIESARRCAECSAANVEIHQIIQNDIPKDQAVCLILTFVEGLSQREIAEYLQVPLGTIKTRIELGVKKVTRLLNGEPARQSRNRYATRSA